MLKISSSCEGVQETKYECNLWSRFGILCCWLLLFFPSLLFSIVCDKKSNWLRVRHEMIGFGFCFGVFNQQFRTIHIYILVSEHFSNGCAINYISTDRKIEFIKCALRLMLAYESIASDATCDRAQMSAYNFKSASHSTPNIIYIFLLLKYSFK